MKLGDKMNYVFISLEEKGNPIAEKLNMFIGSDVYYHYELKDFDIVHKVKQLLEKKRKVTIITSCGTLNLLEKFKEVENRNLIFIYDYEKDIMRPMLQ
ncbi:hypothetical protein [Haloimpatiens massiliensis]|uniref:hypothetical protein n=1 Tax=Haloimpatiens massiliensis TaxID=1658110 RepID=UPI001A9A58C3|nr:hypothetical protein [Haloimpatiens massiliensis]